MNGLIIVGYGLYLIAVTLAGNAKKLKGELSKDGGQFVPWLLAIFVLSALNEASETKPFVNPFIALFLVTLVIKRFPIIDTEIRTLYQHYVHGSKW